MKALVSVVFLVLLLALMISTNPTIQDYSEFLRYELVQKSADEQDDLGQALMLIFGGLTESFIAASTSRANYVILSTYVTDIETYHFECIGAFGNFFRCSSADEQ